jgi:hypothetical protein
MRSMTDVEFEPVVVVMGSAIVALRPRDGTIVWHVPTEQPVVRIYRVDTRLFGVYGTRVVCVELRTGEVIGQVDIGFPPDSGLVCDGRLVLLRGGDASPSPEAIVCLTAEGVVRWHGTLGIEAGKAKLATYSGGAGAPQSTVTFPFRGAPAGIAYRDAVVQPDLNR